jgi:hypothetical protein
MEGAMAKRVENERKFKEVQSILKLGDVDLTSAALFIEMTYVYGSNSESKAYTREAKKHVKALDAKIVELAVRASILNRCPYLTGLVIDLAAIRDDLHGHFWRAERICEIIEKERVC